MKRRYWFLAVLTLCGVLFAGCSKQSAANNGTIAYSAFEEAAERGDAAGAPVQTRKLIKSAEVRVRTDNLDAADSAVADMLAQCGGYASYTTAQDNSRHYTLKVPAAYYETAVNNVTGIGKLLYRSENVEDATIRFYDIDGRLQTKQELLSTFQSYLGKAKNVEEIMTVETRIAELQQEIDWLGSQLSNLSHLIDYATINLELFGPLHNTDSYKPGIGERLAELFRSSGDFLSAALVILVGIIIYGIPAILVLTALYWLLFGKIGLLKKLWRRAAGSK
jgi:hypothetical protein